MSERDDDPETETERDRIRRAPRQAGRRFWDHVYYFMPIILSFVFGALWYALNSAFVYGSLTTRIEGKFELMNYRLEQVEKQLRESNDRAR